MKCSYRFYSAPSPCSYLPTQLSRLEYLHVERLSLDEYDRYMHRGWRRFGRTLYRPACPICSACRALRVDVSRFTPNRSQQRCRSRNEGVVRLRIGPPALSADRLQLYSRFHERRAETHGWNAYQENPGDFHECFVDNPFPTEEWSYELQGSLVGLGYVDAIPSGLSAIYFGHEPTLERHSLGTWNILCLLDEARARNLPHVYLGYHVADCRSLAYKARFRPHELLEADGRWHEPRHAGHGDLNESRTPS